MKFAKITSESGPQNFATTQAIRLAGIRALPKEKRGEYESFSARLLDRQIDFIRCLHELSGNFSLDLRYLFDPGRSPEIVVCLLLKVRGTSEREAAERADSLGGEILRLAMIHNSLHEFRPVSEREELAYLVEPFSFEYLAEIVRREDVIDMDCLDRKCEKTIGFGARRSPQPEPSDAPSSIYYVFPFSLQLDNMERLCNRLLLQNAPCLVSVCLQGYELSEEDEALMEERVRLCEKFAQLTLPVPRHGDVERLEPFLKSQANALYKNCSGELLQLQDAAFLLKIQVASTTPIPRDFITLVGTSITEPSGHPHLPFPEALAGSFSGGYDWVSPEDPAARQAAAANLKKMEFTPWVPTVAGERQLHWRRLFSVNQAAAAFRLPVPTSAEFPGIDTLRHQIKPAPFDLPAEGLLLGENVLLNRRRPIYCSQEDRKRHTYVVGQTGTGKSTLFLNMILQDIRVGRGVGVIDPHGELIEEILPCIPPERVQDVVCFDPKDYERPFGINLLECRTVFEKDFAVNYLIEVFDTLYDLTRTGGPMFEMYMRNALQLLLEQPEDFTPTVLDVPRLFQDRGFRESLLEGTTNPYVNNFWEKEAHRAGGDLSLANIAPYITSKLSRFIYNEIVRVIIGQRTSTVDFRDLMDRGKILLVDLRKGLLGSTNSHFLGMILVGKLFNAALGRGSGLRDFSLYVDEFHNLATPTFVSILSEARKYALSLVITNQYVSQLPKEITAGILGNVGTLISFRVGSIDAEMLSKEFSGVVSENDLMGLPNWQTYVRLSNNGEVCAPFNMHTLAPFKPGHGSAESEIKENSRRQYGRPRVDIEDEIQKGWI